MLFVAEVVTTSATNPNSSSEAINCFSQPLYERAIDELVKIRSKRLLREVNLQTAHCGLIPTASTQTGVSLIAARLTHKLNNILTSDSARRQNLNPPCHLPDECGDLSCSRQGRAFLPARHYPANAKVDQLFDCLRSIRSQIKRPMENDGMRSGETHNLTATSSIDGCVFVEHAKNDAIGSAAESQLEITTQHSKFRGSIAKRARTRAEHDEKRERCRLADFEQGAQ